MPIIAPAGNYDLQQGPTGTIAAAPPSIAMIQRMSGIAASASDCPFSVIAYSTRGGISLKAVRVKIPSRSRPFRRADSVFVPTYSKRRLISVNRYCFAEQQKILKISMVPRLLINWTKCRPFSIKSPLMRPIVSMLTPTIYCDASNLKCFPFYSINMVKTEASTIGQMDVQQDENRDLLDVIMTRRSIRMFVGGEIPPEDIDRILHAAVMAPSPGNRQPWRFHVIRGETKARIVERLGQLGGSQNMALRLMGNILHTVPVLIAVENPMIAQWDFNGDLTL